MLNFCVNQQSHCMIIPQISMQRKPFSYLKTLMNIISGEQIEIYQEFQNYKLKLNKNYYFIAGNENEHVIEDNSISKKISVFSYE